MQTRRRIIVGGLLAAGLALLSCNEQVIPTGTVADTTPPVVSVTKATDTVDINQGLQFTVRASDNVSLKTLTVTVTGAAVLSFDTTFASATSSFTRVFTATVGAGTAGGTVQLEARATDGSDNEATARDSVVVFDPRPPDQTLLAPEAGTAFGAGDTIEVVVRVTDPSGVAKVGARTYTTDAVGTIKTISADSVVHASVPLAVTDTLRVAIPDTLKPGTYLLGTFAVDNVGNRGNGSPVNVGVADLKSPSGSFIAPVLDSNVVAGDSVLVRFRAQDLTGVDSVRLIGVALRGDSTLGTAVVVTRFQAKTATLRSATDTTFARYLIPVVTDSTAETVQLQATVYDVAGNSQLVTSRVQIVRGPFVRVASPAAGAKRPVGVAIPISIAARSPNKVQRVGFTAAGSVVGGDSVQLASPLADSVLSSFSLAVSATATLGSVSLTPFAVDSLGKRIPGASVSVSLTDTLAPSITILTPDSTLRIRPSDSTLVEVRVQDNRGVSGVTVDGVAHRGSKALGTDTVVVRMPSKTVTMTPPVPDTTLTRYLVSSSEQTAEFVYIRIVAQDSSANAARDSVRIELVTGPQLTVLAPGDRSVVAPGKSITVTIRGQGTTTGVRKLGFMTTGVFATTDTAFTYPITNPQVRDTTRTVSLTVPAGTPLGTFTLIPFGRDSLGNIGSGPSVTIEVVGSVGASDTIPPLVTDSLLARVEAADTIRVRATDVGGITRVGFLVSDTAGTLIAGDSTSYPGTATDVSTRFSLGLDTVTTFPRLVVVTAFAVDSVGNRGVLSRTGTPLKTGGAADTVTLVAGFTVSLPAGGRVADAIYNRNTLGGAAPEGEVYLTNIELNRVEVFDISTRTFTAAIPVGSRPWGIALWPRDTLGNNTDTVVVANSGGTDLSVVSVASRAQVRRHQLPLFRVQTVHSKIDEATGLINQEITEYSVSDRPAYVGVVCRDVGADGLCKTAGTPGVLGDVVAVYSTTPTAGQSNPLPRHGTLRWENLTSAAPQSHFLWEQAGSTFTSATDTLQLFVKRGTTETMILGALCGRIVSTNELGFLDTTFVRNSGNFNRVIVGEGGSSATPALAFARALSYDGTLPLQVNTCGADREEVDAGVSGALEVRSFIANTAIPVKSVGINFNGLTNLVRADSVYVLDKDLRLKGLLEIGGPNFGMDLNYTHDYDPNTGLQSGSAFVHTPANADRIAFVASAAPEIDVFDTFYFGKVASIPIRDPVIGPLRVARLPGGVQILVGVTARGVVTVRLPAVTNTFPAARWPGGQ